MKASAVLIVLISISNVALADYCLDRAEQKYFSVSQNLMSRLETGKIDNIDFERARTDAVHLRDRELAKCFETANEDLKIATENMEAALEAMRQQQLQGVAKEAQLKAPRVPTSSAAGIEPQAPRSNRPDVYEEIQPSKVKYGSEQ